MTDAEFRELFALLERSVEPRPEFAERLFANFDAVVTPTAATRSRADNGVNSATEPDGRPPERAYFAGQTDHSPLGFGGPRARTRRVIGVLAAAAAVIVAAVAVVVTELAPVAPGTTAAPVTTGAPGTATGALSGGSGLCPLGFPIVGAGFMPNAHLGVVRLADGQVVHVVGKGCAPGITYTVAECANNGPPGPFGGLTATCLRQSVIADATGTVSTYFKVQKVFPGADCGVASGCVIILNREEASGSNSIEVGPQISFGA
jgi:hypothetical protein